jgi:hypothetical protein
MQRSTMRRVIDHLLTGLVADIDDGIDLHVSMKDLLRELRLAGSKPD